MIYMPNDDSIQSIQKAIRILYAVAGVEDGCSVSQISLKTGIKSHTVYKMTRTLEREHLLTRLKSPLRFVLGSTIRELGVLDEERHLLSYASRVLIRMQSRMMTASFMLLELKDTTTYQRLCVTGNRPGVVIQRREYVVPLYEKASSLLFLAYADPDLSERLYKAHPFDIEGRPYWQTRDRLELFLEKVRRLGYCHLNIPDPDGPYFRVAAPISSPGNDVTATIAGVTLNNAPKAEKSLLIKLCGEGAKEVSKYLLEARG